MPPNGQPAPTSPYPWRAFWLLLAFGVATGIGVLPYMLELFGTRILAAGGTVSLPLLIVMQSLQLTLILGLAIGFGLLLARKVQLPTPLLDRWVYRRSSARFAWTRAVIGGIAIGLITTFGIQTFLAGRVAGWPNMSAIPFWMRLLSAVYSGIDEELLIRLFLFGLVLWLVQKIGRTAPRNRAAFWIANCIVTVLFVLAYLSPASLLFRVTPLVIATFAICNGSIGLLLGYLCYNDGLEAAMIAHFLGIAIAQIAGPLFTG